MQKEPSLHRLQQGANSLVYRTTKIIENNDNIALIAGVLWNVWNLPADKRKKVKIFKPRYRLDMAKIRMNQLV